MSVSGKIKIVSNPAQGTGEYFSYPSPRTDWGVALDAPALQRVPRVRLHDAGWRSRPGPWRFHDVCSPFWRLYCNDRAGAAVEDSYGSHALSPGRLVVVPEGVRFSTQGDFSSGSFWLHFSLFPTVSQPSRIVVCSNLATATPVLQSIRKILRAGSSEKQLSSSLSHLSSALVHLVLEHLHLDIAPPLHRSLTRLLEAIEGQPGGDWSNPAMARFAGMSPAHFTRIFHREIRQTPQTYLLDRRIREAARLLVVTPASIEHIAEACGFANRHHFTRVFAAQTSTTPAAFRRQGQPLA